VASVCRAPSRRPKSSRGTHHRAARTEPTRHENTIQLLGCPHRTDACPSAARSTAATMPLQIDALVAAARGAARGCAERAADHHRRLGLRRAQHLRRRDPDRRRWTPRRRRAELHRHPFDRALLADAGGADHRAQPPFGGLRRDLGAVDGLSRLQQHHRAEDKATIGRILLDNGYNTSWFGKDHNTPAFEASQAGPFDQWPTGMGFQYFYGFVGGDANQWQPNLFRNTTQIYPFDGRGGMEPDDRDGGRRHRTGSPTCTRSTRRSPSS
jgi:hypothetical protein